MRLTDEVVSLFGISSIFRDNTALVNSLDFSRDGRTLVTASDDESMRIYNCYSAEQTRLRFSKKYGVCHLRLTHNDGHGICASRNGWDETIRYLNIEDNKFLRYFHGHRDRVTSLSLHPNSEYFLSSSLDCSVRLWDLRCDTCEGLVRIRNNEKKSCSGVACYDAEGLCFAVASSQSLALYDCRYMDKGPFTSYCLTGFSDTAVVSALSFRQDGAYILITSPTYGVLWVDAFSGKIMHHISLPELVSPPVIRPSLGTVRNERSVAGINKPSVSYISGLAACSIRTPERQASFSPDGQYVAYGGTDGKIYIWGVISGALVAVLPKHASTVNIVEWNPKYLMLASCDQVLQLWTPPFLSSDAY